MPEARILSMRFRGWSPRCYFIMVGTDNADHNASHVIVRRGIRLLLEGKIQKSPVRRRGSGKQKQLGQEACVKASGEENKTQGPKRLCASQAKEGSAREIGTPTYKQSAYVRKVHPEPIMF